MNKSLGKQKLIKDISASTIQTAVTQIFGLIIFYITSKYLSKVDFGEFNWSMAVGSTIIVIASLGLDLVFVKRIALGDNILVITGIHFFHTVAIGIILCLIAFCINIFIPQFKLIHPLFFFIFVNLALANIANSFKLCLNGLEAYRQLAILSLLTNVFKFSLILFFYLKGNFNISNVIIAYISTSFLEFMLGYFMMNKQLYATVIPLLKINDYKYFIFESLPQLGVVLFDSALARIDWILLGIIGTASATAEYSFVYRVFELSKLPIIIIAPILLTRFSKLFNKNETISDKNKHEIHLFLKIEMLVIMFIPIVLVSMWSPLVDYFTNNKYGAVNEKNYWILAFCIPLHGIINFLWTMGFAQGQLKTIMYITIVVSLLNIILNILLIPLYSSLGASITFLLCTILQLVLYLKYINQSQIRLSFINIVITIMNAFIAILIGKISTNNVIFAGAFSIVIYSILSLITKQFNIKQLKEAVLINRSK